MEIAQLVVVGIIVGSIIGLGGIGLTLTYGVMKFANFAHGDLMSLGMFLALFIIADAGLGGGTIGPLSFGWGMIPAILFAMVGIALITVALDRVVFRPLRSRGSGIVTMAIASLGLGIMIRALVQLIWGPSPERYVGGINRATTIFLDLKVKPDQFFIVGLTLILVICIFLLLYRTKLGTAMRATADNPGLAEASRHRHRTHPAVDLGHRRCADRRGRCDARDPGAAPLRRGLQFSSCPCSPPSSWAASAILGALWWAA